mgnify:CR=1 FL=1
MSVDGKFENISREDLHAVGERFLVPGYRAIVREIEKIVDQWPDFAAEAQLPPERTDAVRARLSEVRL